MSKSQKGMRKGGREERRVRRREERREACRQEVEGVRDGTVFNIRSRKEAIIKDDVMMTVTERRSEEKISGECTGV